MTLPHPLVPEEETYAQGSSNNEPEDTAREALNQDLGAQLLMPLFLFSATLTLFQLEISDFRKM